MKPGRKLWLVIGMVITVLALLSANSIVPLTVVAEPADAPKVTVDWASVSPMSKPRHAGATVVVDGVIYTIGGAETGGSYKYLPPGAPPGHEVEISIDTTGIRVEAYDPASNKWTAKASLPYPPDIQTKKAEGRLYLGAAAYKGKIYTFGGADVNGVVKDTVDVYDIATDTWTAGIAKLPKPTASISAVTYGDRIYLFGGSTSTADFAAEDFYGDCYEFDPATVTFTPKASMPNPRTRTSAAVFKNQIMVFGGSSAWGNRNAMVYDPATNSWSFRDVVVWERAYWFGTVANDMVFLMGGRNDEERITCTEANVYNDEWQTWVTATNMPLPRENAFVAAVGGKLYVMGGSDNKGNPEATPTPLNSAFRGTVPSTPPTLDLTEIPEEVKVTIAWSKVAPMPTPRYYGAAVVVDNIIYVIGGLESESLTGKVVEAYDPVANKWTTKASLPEGRFNMPATACNGKIYIFGGVNTKLKIMDTVDVYDIATNTWTAGIAKLPKPAAGVAAVNYADMIFLFGGSRSPMLFVPSKYYYSDVYMFDPVALTFTACTPMPVARNMSFVGVVDEGICLVGGVESTGATVNSVYSAIADTRSRMEMAKYAGNRKAYEEYEALLKKFEAKAKAEAKAVEAAWKARAEMPAKRGGHSGAVLASAVSNCNVFVIGGHAKSSVLAYNSKANAWQQATRCAVGRNVCQVVVAKASPESIYVMGGMDKKGYVVSIVEKGTPYEGTPPTPTPPPTPEPTPTPSPTPTPPPSPTPPPDGGAGCAKSSLARGSFDFSPVLLGLVWVGAALALGSRRKRNRQD